MELSYVSLNLVNVYTFNSHDIKTESNRENP